jgi:hypothetical protein
MKKLQALAIACAVLLAPAWARAEWVNATVSQQANVHRQANDSSEILGHLREGKTIRIYRPDRNGFYAVNFGKPIKGTSMGWIATSDVQIADGAAAPPAAGGHASRSSGGGGGNRGSWVDIDYNLVMMSPSAFQTKIEEDTKGVSGTQFGLTYGHRIRGSSLGWVLGGFYYTVNGSGTVHNGTYKASGFGANAGLDYALMNSRDFTLSMLGSIGMGVNSAGNTTTAVSFNTTNILSFPIRIELNLRKYWGTFGLTAAGGYQIATLSAVPVVLPEAGSPPPESTADFNLSGIYGRIGVSFNFE